MRRVPADDLPWRLAYGRFILNCDPSTGVQMDWTFADAVEAGVVADAAARAEVDLRADDWAVRDQGTTGACVGFAAADGVLHWHYRQAGLLAEGERPLATVHLDGQQGRRICSPRSRPRSSNRRERRSSSHCGWRESTAVCRRARCPCAER